MTLMTMDPWKWITTSVILISSCQGKICPRDKSRVVAGTVQSRILPAFNRLHIPLNPKCKFSLERDMYTDQENNKVYESAGRWTCDFCGKGFVSEFFLDKHFENRHEDKVQTVDSVCLADVCDVFRCDIVSGASQPDYWDIALCLEDDMQELYSQCQVLVDDCIPPGLTKNETKSLKNEMMTQVCSYLTCSKFWNTPFHEEANTHTALYIVLTTMTIFGIIIYNFVFYNYFYSDLVDSSYETIKKKHHIKAYRPGAADLSRQSRHRSVPVRMEMEPA